jgi:arsenate reductase (thioredoxin)
MSEVSIDISSQVSKSVDNFMEQQFDYVITVCDNANEQCPVFPGKTMRIHWSFEDPAEAEGDLEERLKVFRRVRDKIREKLEDFAKETI